MNKYQFSGADWNSQVCQEDSHPMLEGWVWPSKTNGRRENFLETLARKEQGGKYKSNGIKFEFYPTLQELG